MMRNLCYGLLFTTLLVLLSTALLPDPADGQTLDDTGGFLHTTPNFIHTTNGCGQFTISFSATLTDARVFGLRFYFDQTNLELISITSGSDPTLHLMPDSLYSDTLWLDGFFSPNKTGSNVILATLTVKAISPGDVTTHIGFLDGMGFSGTGENPESILFNGDSATVMIEGTAPRPPQGVIIVPLIPPSTDDSVRIQWHPVTLDLDGNAVVNPLYHVMLHDVVHDTAFTIAETPDTFLYDRYIHYNFPISNPPDTVWTNIGYYEVRACKTQP
jgi:hypothetical protein